MDYRDLLSKYMKHVADCEGIDFTDRLNGYAGSDVVFNEEEILELTRISAEIRDQA